MDIADIHMDIADIDMDIANIYIPHDMEQKSLKILILPILIWILPIFILQHRRCEVTFPDVIQFCL